MDHLLVITSVVYSVCCLLVCLVFRLSVVGGMLTLALLNIFLFHLSCSEEPSAFDQLALAR